MTALLTPLLLTLGPLALLLVVAVVFAESGLLLGFFLPGDSLLFLTGALTASHVIGLPLWLVAGCVAVAAVLGDQTGYLLGRRFGPALFRPGSRFSRFLRPEHVERTRVFLERRGDVAVVTGRFVPVVRSFVPAVAGVAGMPRARFTAYNLVGAVLWGVGLVVAGALFGGIPFVAAHVEAITIGLAGLSVVPLLVAAAHRRRQRRHDRAPEPAAEPVTAGH
ncbi:MAG: DedA family protein [Aeromicrobium erythreum]